MTGISARLLYASIAAAFGGFIFGYGTAVISGAIDAMEVHYGLSPIDTGWTVSSMIVGCAIGAMAANKIVSPIGRKNGLLIAAVVYLLSMSASAVAVEFWIFVSTRIVAGFAIGLISVVSPMYLSEMAPAQVRGRVVSLFQVLLVTGQAIAFWVNYLLANGQSDLWLQEEGWRWMMWAAVVPSLVFIMLLFGIPESPRWLYMKGRRDDAKTVLRRLLSHADAEALFQQISDSLDKEHVTVSLSARPSLRFITRLAVFVAVAQQLVGINVVIYYGPSILTSVTQSTDSAFLQMTYLGVLFIFGNLLGMYLVDRVGRVPLIKWGSLGCALGMVWLGIVIYQSISGYVALIALLLYMVSFAVSWGCTCWVIVSEIAPTEVRSKVMSLAIFGQWVACFIVAQVFPLLDRNPYLQQLYRGGFSFWLFGGLTLVCMLVTLRYLPETRGVALERVEQLFQSRMRNRLKV